MSAHWRHLANTIEPVLPLAHQSPQPRQQIDRFSHFRTAHGRALSGTLAPPGKYDWICASFGPPESTTKTANWSVQLFLHSSRQNVPTLYNGALSPKIGPCHGGSGPPSNTWFPGSTTVLNPNGISIGSAIFVGHTSVTGRQTDYTTQSVTTNNRPHLYLVLRCGQKINYMCTYLSILVVHAQDLGTTVSLPSFSLPPLGRLNAVQPRHCAKSM